MSEPLVSAWCVNTRQSRRYKRRGILRAMLVTSGVLGGPVGRRRRFLLLGDRLTARPKHPDFRERASLRGAAKERKSPVDVENVRRALQAFITPKSATEGARGFRRRGAHAQRSPGDGARQKRAAERGKSVGPLLGGFGPCCSFLAGSSCAGDELPTSLWAASSQLLDVTAFPALASRRRLQNRRILARKKSGKKKAAQSLARGSADDAADGTASSNTVGGNSRA